MEVWTGFIVGLAGSLHCIGMCGPIAFALPVSNQSNFKIMLGRVLYNLGRVVTYSILGALFGLFGSRLVLFGLQQHLSIGFGIIIMIYVFTPGKIKTKIAGTFFYKHATALLKSQFAKLLSVNSNSSLFTIGLLNGLLPCGFVYVGIAGAVSTGNFLSGSFYMALFGLGTFPAMLAASVFGKFININLKRKINRFVPVLAVVLAILFILRGMNLGIPYISPKFVKAAPLQQEVCH
ncbi:MAG: sulfite exporter TauE/SafE family protein [Ignavibacteriales bacterium]|nr:sulfite exporter TauE/SafE family protein [Ignavibacteriales bacterium]